MERKLDASSAVVQNVDEKLGAIRALEEKLEVLAHRQRELAVASYGRRQQLFAFGAVLVAILLAAGGTILVLR